MVMDSAKPLQGYQGSEEFLKLHESRQGKATFKLAQPQQQNQASPVAEKGMLSSEEIIRISEENNLTRAEVYQIRSMFASMVKMCNHHEQKSGCTTISIEFFQQNCPFLMTSLPEICKRVLVAAGKLPVWFVFF